MLYFHHLIKQLTKTAQFLFKRNRLSLLFGLFAIFFITSCDQSVQKKLALEEKAFLDSKTPPDLAPEAYPPSGFVFSSFQIDDLPAARYGVTSPNLKPKAQVLILAEPGYAAEAYFGIMSETLKSGASVWILEFPGQGGSGRFQGQKSDLAALNAAKSKKLLTSFLKKVMTHGPDKPLYIVSSGVGATQAVQLLTISDKDPPRMIFLYEPYTGQDLTKTPPWSRKATPSTELAAKSYPWELFNPDLRRISRDDEFIKNQKKALDETIGAPAILSRLSQNTVDVNLFHALKNSDDSFKHLQSYCRHFKQCKAHNVLNLKEFSVILRENIENDLQKILP